MNQSAESNCSTSFDLIGRRGFLRAGALAMGGLSIAEVLRQRAVSDTARHSRPKSVIMIFLSGGPSHLDMYDMKPHAPREYRGEFSPIRTNVPGMEVCELMPMQAKIADKFAILRGFRGANLHTGNNFFSGFPWQESPRASVPGEARRPALGSVVSRVRNSNSPMPPYVSLRGQHDWERAYYLGRAHEPFHISAPSGGYNVINDMKRPPGVTADRVRSRKQLLGSLDRLRRDLDMRGNTSAIDEFQRRALGIVTSSKVRDAFDIDREPKAVRLRYGEGMASNGQEPWRWLLQARRLIEAGVSVVTACTYGWDTHRDNFKMLREMVPSLDRAVHALITDLDNRGMLDDVAVVMGGEFGRTPRIGDITPDGRSHWPDAGFLWVAGGGLKTGQVIGATDARGEKIIGRPIVMPQMIATLYRVLGIDATTTFRDHNGRPQYVLENRETVPGLL